MDTGKPVPTPSHVAPPDWPTQVQGSFRGYEDSPALGTSVVTGWELRKEPATATTER